MQDGQAKVGTEEGKRGLGLDRDGHYDYQHPGSLSV